MLNLFSSTYEKVTSLFHCLIVLLPTGAIVYFTESVFEVVAIKDCYSIGQKSVTSGATKE